MSDETVVLEGVSSFRLFEGPSSLASAVDRNSGDPLASNSRSPCGLRGSSTALADDDALAASMVVDCMGFIVFSEANVCFSSGIASADSSFSASLLCARISGERSCNSLSFALSAWACSNSLLPLRAISRVSLRCNHPNATSQQNITTAAGRVT